MADVFKCNLCGWKTYAQCSGDERVISRHIKKCNDENQKIPKNTKRGIMRLIASETYQCSLCSWVGYTKNGWDNSIINNHEERCYGKNN